MEGIAEKVIQGTCFKGFIDFHLDQVVCACGIVLMLIRCVKRLLLKVDVD